MRIITSRACALMLALTAFSAKAQAQTPPGEVVSVEGEVVFATDGLSLLAPAQAPPPGYRLRVPPMGPQPIDLSVSLVFDGSGLAEPETELGVPFSVERAMFSDSIHAAGRAI